MMRVTHRLLMGIALLVICTAGLSGQRGGPDWTQWRGPNRDGAVASFTEPKAWPEQLTQRWKVEVGLGKHPAIRPRS